MLLLATVGLTWGNAAGYGGEVGGGQELKRFCKMEGPGCHFNHTNYGTPL